MQHAVHQDIPALDIANVSKIYTQWQRSGQWKDIVKNLVRPEKKEVKALNDLSLQVQKGEFVAYAGANGAGKSTTIKILSGILQPTMGRVTVLGMSPAKDRVELMRRIGVLFGQRTELWWDHPVITSYNWKKNVWNIPESVYQENLAMVTELLDLKDLLTTFSRELSLGQRMRADLGMLLLHSPEVLFLDEPTLGLDVLAKRQMIEFLKKVNRENGTTVIVTSHDMDDLEAMAQRIILLSNGKIAFDGDFHALRKMQGGFTRLLVSGPERPPEWPGMEWVATSDGVHEYAFQQSDADFSQVLKTLAGTPGITDLEMRKAPIEEVVASLYMAWKKESA
jgi:ABC-2 type transport system ATP-binding protein